MTMQTTVDARKPLGGKAYGHIPHLPGSRMGPGDHHCHDGQARIATVQARDKHDTIIVQEKLDGSCMSVAKVNGEIVALGRAGYRAITSKFYQHVLFDGWVNANYRRFDALLQEGERVVGEWLAQAHGTRYTLDTSGDVFCAFDLFLPNGERATAQEVADRTISHDVLMVQTFHVGEPLSITDAMQRVRYEAIECNCYGFHGALDPVEGAVWRVERDGRVDFLVKYVRPDKVDGCYLPEISGGEAYWNWKPETT